MLDAQQIPSDVLAEDQWATLSLEGRIQVLKDTKQAHLNSLVRLNQEDRMGTQEWHDRLADLRTINSELKYLNGG